MTDVLRDRLGMSGVKCATRRTGLVCESQLRIAASTLRRGVPQEITAVTTVGIVGPDDLNALNNLVAAIEEEFDVDASVRLYVGSFSVRFTPRLRL